MSTPAVSDEDLVRRFAHGEARAFDQLYQRYELAVFRYLLRNLRNRALAEDLQQDTWFAVIREAPRYEPVARFSAWLFRIAHNKMIDAIRTARPEVSLTLVAEEREPALAVGRADCTSSPYAAAVASEQLAALLTALAQLPREQCQVFLLQQEGGLSIEEIADVAGCNFETAKSRLRYARAKLRELLQESA
jgi:RNA polymerase sigma factor (sigma-70 family)